MSFTWYELDKAYAIARTSKSNRTLYFYPEIINDEKQDDLKESFENKPKDFQELKKFLCNPILMKHVMITEDDGEFIPLPTFTQNRSVFNIISSSGSGKSVLLSKILKEFQRIKKNDDFEYFLLTNKEEEPAFKELKDLKRLPVYDLEKPITSLEKFRKSVWILDDILEGIDMSNSEFLRELDKQPIPFTKKRKIQKEKELQVQNVVEKSAEAFLTLGRSYEINLFLIKHEFRDGRKNLWKMEATHSVFFPSNNKSKIIEYLKSVEGLTKPEIETVMNLKNSKTTYQFLVLSRFGLRWCLSNRDAIALD